MSTTEEPPEQHEYTKLELLFLKRLAEQGAEIQRLRDIDRARQYVDRDALEQVYAAVVNAGVDPEAVLRAALGLGAEERLANMVRRLAPNTGPLFKPDIGLPPGVELLWDYEAKDWVKARRVAEETP